MRKILVAGNWKMNSSQAMVSELLTGLMEGTRDGADVDMAVFPPFPYLAQALNRARVPFGLDGALAPSAGSLEGFLQGLHGLIKLGGIDDAGQARDRGADRQDIDVG